MTMIQRHINLLNAWVLLTYIKLSSQYSNSRLDTGKPATATASQEGVDSLGAPPSFAVILRGLIRLVVYFELRQNRHLAT